MTENELDAVKKKLQEAHDAENRLRQTMPNAIQPDEEAEDRGDAEDGGGGAPARSDRG